MDSEEEKTAWEKYEPKALSSITFKGNFTYEHNRYYVDADNLPDGWVYGKYLDIKK